MRVATNLMNIIFCHLYLFCTPFFQRENVGVVGFTHSCCGVGGVPDKTPIEIDNGGNLSLSRLIIVGLCL